MGKRLGSASFLEMNFTSNICRVEQKEVDSDECAKFKIIKKQMSLLSHVVNKVSAYY